jgi:hypothetical protein
MDETSFWVSLELSPEFRLCREFAGLPERHDQFTRHRIGESAVSRPWETAEMRK